MLEYVASLGVEAVALVAAHADHAFGAQALEHFAHTEEGQRDIQLFELAMYTAHTDAATVPVSHVQGIDDF
ncbi:hypothetical protein D3C80_2071270 [compost metagenome]